VKKKWRISVLFIIMLSLVLMTSYFGNERVAKATGPYLTVNVMDVDDSGYIVQLPNGKVMVVDAGRDTELSKVYARLDALGITTIDYLVGTHQHGDHISNFNNIINSGKYTIGEIDFPANPAQCDNSDCTAMMSAASSHSIPVNRFNAGSRIFPTETVNGLDLKTFVYSPRVDSDYSSEYSGSELVNSYSMVFNVKYGAEAFLFTGDALPATTQQMMDHYGSIPGQQVMSAPHHGYTAWITDDFLDFMNNGGTNKIVIENPKLCGSPDDFKYRLQTRGDYSYWSIAYNHNFAFQTDGTSWTTSASGTGNIATPEWAPGDAVVPPLYPNLCNRTPLGQWNFDETSGTTAADSSGNGHNGTLDTGASWSASGKTNRSVSLNGTSTGDVSLPFLVNPASTPFTISAFVKLDAVSPGFNQIIMQQTGTNGESWLIRNSSGHLASYIGGTATVSTGTIPTGVWTHVAMVYDGSTVQLYLNGVADGSSAKVAESSTGSMLVGIANNFSANKAWHGEIDDLLIYDSALGSDNIKSLYSYAYYPQ
jgi:beta-lactamase superfamily II metal-dependent hydrolase